jgi:hypothetical protein
MRTRMLVRLTHARTSHTHLRYDRLLHDAAAFKCTGCVGLVPTSRVGLHVARVSDGVSRYCNVRCKKRAGDGGAVESDSMRVGVAATYERAAPDCAASILARTQGHGCGVSWMECVSICACARAI